MPAAILLLALYLIIFCFSSQNGEESGVLSKSISTPCMEFLESISGQDWNHTMLQSMVEYFEHPIRKIAHFTEYSVMGLLIWTILEQWMNDKKLKWIIAVVWIILSASADEIHQLFVPGRYGSVLDVILDTSGGIFGVFLCQLCFHFFRKRVQK